MRWLVRRVVVGGAVLSASAASVLAAPPARAAGEFHFAETGLHASEGQAMVRVVVQRGDLPVARASVGYRTEAGTASPGSDYADTAGTLTFDVGETHASFTVFLRDDDVPEGRETVLLLLENDGRSQIRLTIEDDDLAASAATTGAGANAMAVASAAPASDQRAGTVAPSVRSEAPPAVARRRTTTVVRRAPAAAPRRAHVRQSPVTPFELRPAAPSASGPPAPSDVDAGLAAVAAFLLARVAAEVWFRTRSLSP